MTDEQQAQVLQPTATLPYVITCTIVLSTQDQTENSTRFISILALGGKNILVHPVDLYGVTLQHLRTFGF